MRYLTSLVFVAALSGQTYVYDVDGRKVPIAGPQESRQRKVLEDGPGGKTVEETIERRDASGNKLPPERVVTVERKNADGTKVTETTVMQTDLNGRMVAKERTVQTTQEQGATTFVNTVVERPTVNGGFSTVEKLQAQTVKTEGKETTTRSTYVTDANGQFKEAVRELVEKVPDGKGTRETVQEFRNAQTGKLELSGQRVTLELQNADGTKSSEVTIYGAVAQGRTSDGKLKVREQQLITSKPGPGNTVVESISVRRPDLADSKMGSYQKVAEKVTTAPAKP